MSLLLQSEIMSTMLIIMNKYLFFIFNIFPLFIFISNQKFRFPERDQEYFADLPVNCPIPVFFVGSKYPARNFYLIFPGYYILSNKPVWFYFFNRSRKFFLTI